jgi:hypothetical protein
MNRDLWFAVVMLVGGAGLGWIYRDLWAVYLRRRRCRQHHPAALCDRCGTVVAPPEEPR